VFYFIYFLNFLFIIRIKKNNIFFDFFDFLKIFSTPKIQKVAHWRRNRRAPRRLDQAVALLPGVAHRGAHPLAHLSVGRNGGVFYKKKLFIHLF
jgi:hypothetical protein